MCCYPYPNPKPNPNPNPEPYPNPNPNQAPDNVLLPGSRDCDQPALAVSALRPTEVTLTPTLTLTLTRYHYP